MLSYFSQCVAKILEDPVRDNCVQPLVDLNKINKLKSMQIYSQSKQLNNLYKLAQQMVEKKGNYLLALKGNGIRNI